MSLEDVVNKRLSYSKEMIKQINHVKGMSNDLDDVLILAFAGMLAYYGQERLNDIYLAFLKTDFVLCDEPVEKVIGKKFKLSEEVVKEMCEHGQGTFYDVTGNEFIDRNHKRTYKFNRKVYVAKDADKTKTLEGIVHQVNHVLNSIHNPVVSTRGGLAARMGISFDKFVSRETTNIRLEESINSLQKDDIVDKIYGFRECDIHDDSIRSMLDTVCCTPREKIADDEITEIIRPLYEDDFFKYIFLDKRVSGRLNGIRAEFDSYTDEGDYNLLLGYIDAVTKANSEDEKTQNKSDAKQLVMKYITASNDDN